MSEPPPNPQSANEPSAAGGGVEVAPGVRVEPAALRYTAVRSSGPGGQNVNKRATKVELRIAIDDIPLAPAPKARLRRAAGRQLTDAGELIIQSDEARTQLANRRACLERLRAMLIHAMAVPKKRIPTKPSRGSKERRLESKRQQSQKKEQRRKPLL